jgi:hypothetical protein
MRINMDHGNGRGQIHTQVVDVFDAKNWHSQFRLITSDSLNHAREEDEGGEYRITTFNVHNLFWNSKEANTLGRKWADRYHSDLALTDKAGLTPVGVTTTCFLPA